MITNKQYDDYIEKSKKNFGRVNEDIDGNKFQEYDIVEKYVNEPEYCSMNNPTKHIILKNEKDEFVLANISDNQICDLEHIFYPCLIIKRQSINI